MEPKERVELSTYGLQNRCSNQLSYFGDWSVEQFIIQVFISQSYEITKREQEVMFNMRGFWTNASYLLMKGVY